TAPSGPPHAERRVPRPYPAGIAYEVRIAAFAGERFLRLQHTITNLADAHYAPLRSLLLAADDGRTGFRILAPLMKSSGGPAGARAADAALRTNPRAAPAARPRPRRP